MVECKVGGAYFARTEGCGRGARYKRKGVGAVVICKKKSLIGGRGDQD